MIYQTLLATGALGVLAMGLTGLRGGRGGRARGRGRGKGRSGSGRTRAEELMGLLSPMTLFALSLGAGAAGVALEKVVREPWKLALLAIVIGFLFWKLAVEPLQELVFRFASEPSKNLEGATATEARVESRFDEKGQGMVSITVDGQIRRVLAHFIDHDPRSVAIGEKVIVVDVDTKRNTCRVARL